MADPDALPDESLPLDLELRIDPVCQSFEAAWRVADGGPPPRIEDHLAAAAEEDRGPLLRELVKVELHYRRDEHPSLEEYQRRFPAYAERLGQLFDAQPESGSGSRCGPETVDADAPGGRGGDTASGGPNAARQEPADSSPRSEDRPPPRIPGYEILGKLGEGGMGIVFEAADPVLQRAVALKMMRPEIAAQATARQRFLREARAMAALQHERIVAVHQCGEATTATGPVPFLVMPLLRGETLGACLKRERRPPLAEVLRIAREMAEGLAAAHAAGLIHRDIKPENVWLETPPGPPETPLTGGRVKLLDFGLARAADSGPLLSHPGAVVGTPAYMAPEQAAGETVDARADLFSLGCVLYEMTTGQRPFAGPNRTSILTQIATHHPTPPDQLDAKVPAAWSALVMRLLAKKPEERPGSVAEVLAAIRAIDGGPGPPTVEYAGQRTAGRQAGRRRWVVAAAVGLGSVLLAAALAVLFRQPGPTPSTNRSEAGTRSEPVAPLKGDIDVLVWKGGNARLPGLRLGDVGALPLTARDEFAVEVEMERPAYVYVVWIDADGEVLPVYPWQAGHWESPRGQERPIKSLRRPEALNHLYPVPEEPGMETLVLLARETPLPADVDLQAEVGKFDKQTAQDIRACVWFENGKEVKDRPGRGAGRFDEKKIHDPVMEAQQRIKEKLQRHFSYTRAVSFANQGK
jgi:tRNA A-37 threonylcarbamoyl transferase component Bud32